MQKRPDKLYCCTRCAGFDKYVRELEAVVDYVYKDARNYCAQMQGGTIKASGRCIACRVGADGRCMFAIEGRCSIWDLIKKIEGVIQ